MVLSIGAHVILPLYLGTHLGETLKLLLIRAKIACEQANQAVSDQFVGFNKLI